MRLHCGCYLFTRAGRYLVHPRAHLNMALSGFRMGVCGSTFIIEREARSVNTFCAGGTPTISSVDIGASFKSALKRAVFLVRLPCTATNYSFTMPSDIRSFFGGKGGQGAVSSQDKPAASAEVRIAIMSTLRRALCLVLLTGIHIMSSIPKRSPSPSAAPHFRFAALEHTISP